MEFVYIIGGFVLVTIVISYAFYQTLAYFLMKNSTKSISEDEKDVCRRKLKEGKAPSPFCKTYIKKGKCGSKTCDTIS